MDNNTDLLGAKQYEQLGKTVTVNLPAADMGETTEGFPAMVLTEPYTTYNGRVVAIYGNKLIVADKGRIIYEPELRENLGADEEYDLPIKCFYEKSCGAIVYTVRNGERLYLLVKTGSGHIGFPKGHIVAGETEEETAIREIFEETGLTVRLDRGKRWHYEYMTLKNTTKKCVYFLASFGNEAPIFQQDEIFAHWLVPYSEAMLLLNFVQDKELLAEADRRLGR